MDEPAALRLAFHIESPGTAAESLKHMMGQIEGVQTVETRVLQTCEAEGVGARAGCLVPDRTELVPCGRPARARASASDWHDPGRPGTAGGGPDGGVLPGIERGSAG